jgi:hypothetical protein
LGGTDNLNGDYIYAIGFGNPNNTQMGIGPHGTNRSIWGREGITHHIHQDDEWTIKSSSWTNLFGVQGGTGNVYMRGSVGIGTTNPSGPLHVEAPDGYVSVNASGTNDFTGFRLRDNNSDRGWLGLAGVADHFSNGSANGDIILRSQNNLLFAAGGNTTRIYVKSDGLIGIKTTSPEYSLDFGETSASTIRLVSEHNGTAIRVGAGGGNRCWWWK